MLLALCRILKYNLRNPLCIGIQLAQCLVLTQQIICNAVTLASVNVFTAIALNLQSMYPAFVYPKHTSNT